MEGHVRSNVECAKIIELGVQIEQNDGCAVAWAFLAYHSVPTTTILRVLTSPLARRHSDTPRSNSLAIGQPQDDAHTADGLAATSQWDKLSG